MDTPNKLNELREKVGELKVQAEVEFLETVLGQHELEKNLLEGWGDVVDPYDQFRGEPEFFPGGNGGSTISRPTDKARGDNFPHFDNEQKLSIIRGMGEYIATKENSAIHALQVLSGYTIGTGIVREITPVGETPGALVDALENIVDEFLSRTGRVGELDDELFKRTRKSGERFVHVRDLGNGFADVDIHEPSWITEPRNARQFEAELGLPSGLDWKYGIASSWGRPQDVWGYFSVRNGDESDWQFIPAEEMCHCKVNVDSNVKRGLSDFYAGEEWISAVKKLLTNTFEGASVQAAIALIRQWNDKAKPSEIKGAADGLVQFQSVNRGTGGNREVATERFYPGKILDIKGGEMKAGPLGQLRSPVYVQVADAGERQAAKRWSMPYNVYSGDASAANYASTLVAQDPFVQFCMRLQGSESNHLSGELQRVCEIAARAGRLDHISPHFRQDPKSLWQLVELTAKGGDIIARDAIKDHQIRKEENLAGILSRETWAEETSRDYASERKKIAAEPPVGQPEQTPGFPVGMSPESLGQLRVVESVLPTIETVDDAVRLLEAL